ncbi:MAG TPA: hydantoinase B/oxoprolinase family protein [Actinomycetota bacterium]|nr:hydantoinase B/oxoprolinase family protein [Actinomycetota bacterium]
MTVDPFVREIVGAQLRSAAREMFVTLGRASQSPIIYEVLDYACGLCDRDGYLVAEAEGIPGFIGTLGHAAQEILAQHEGGMTEGDVYVLNDPFRGGGTHLSDVALVAPVYFDGARVAFAVNKAHWTEVGGVSAGSWSPDTREIHQEGLIFPGVPLYRRGELNDALVELIRANVRLPDATLGDLFAGVAGLRTARERVQDICRRLGVGILADAMRELHEVGAQSALAALRALPAGVYEASDFMDDDGVSDEPVPVRVAVEISPEGMRCDFTGSGAQAPGSVNSTWSSLHAACRSAYKAVIGPDLATTDGLFRPLEIVAPEGSIFNATYPAPVGVYWESSDYATDLVWKALAPVVPHRLTAGHHLSVCGTLVSGPGFILVEAQAGGWGAALDRDGVSALYPCGDGDTRNIPAEVCEHRYPVRVRRYELRRDDAGAGRRRGGRGLVREYEVLCDGASLTASFGRHRFAPWGVDGGAPGSENAVEVLRAGGVVARSGKLSGFALERGDVVRIITGSGGGWGPPA